MNAIKDECVFGPIPSRRLGLSLGIDLLPFKTCSMDCIYCECGKTTNLTMERREYYPTATAIAQIDAALSRHPQTDYVTFSGVGEPTLHSGLGEIIRHIRTRFPELKLCLLTNSTTLPLPGVIEEVSPCTVIIPSLDGSNAAELLRINRYEQSVSFDAIVQGLIELRRHMAGQMWLEIFAVKGINDTREAALRFRELVARIQPHKVQLNTLDRPGTEKNVEIPESSALALLQSIIGEAAPTELIGGRAAQQAHGHEEGIAAYNRQIVDICRSRPCTAADIAQSLGFDLGMVTTHLRRIAKEGLLHEAEGPRGTYYRAN